MAGKDSYEIDDTREFDCNILRNSDALNQMLEKMKIGIDDTQDKKKDSKILD